MKTIPFSLPLILILIFIQSCKEVEYPIKLGGNYFISHDSEGRTVIIDTNRAHIIVAEIVAWNFDSIFITAKQKPYRFIMDSLEIEYPIGSSVIIEKKFYKKIELYNYWIIDKRVERHYYSDGSRRINKNAIKGPLTYEEYWEKRTELNVSDTLKLKESEKVSFDSPLHALLYKLKNKPREKIVE